ncbi:MAG: multicopper oxidase domain-containing protein [Verrucomicrobiota bacterium]
MDINSSVSRRSFIKAVGVGYVGLNMPTRLLGQAVVSTNPPLIIPQTWESVDGVLGGDLNVVFAENTLANLGTIYTRTFEGMIPGPIWKVNPGDTIEFLLRNQLPPNTDGETVTNPNRPHQWNTTNVHTHGMHVSPLGNGDNVFTRINPGSTFQYNIHIPEDHPGGIAWYHPHKHGGVFQQVRSGMASAIIITGPLDDVPEVAAAREIPLILQVLELTYDDDNARWEVEEPVTDTDDPEAAFPTCVNALLVNGQTAMTGTTDCTQGYDEDSVQEITVQPGELVRWRIANAAGTLFVPINMTNEDGSENLTYYAIATDNITFAEPREETDYLLSPGQRIEILWKSDTPGTYYLQKGAYAPRSTTDDEPTWDALNLVKVIVEGDPVDMPLPETLPVQVTNIDASEVENTRTVDLNTVDDEINGLEFQMDGRLLDPSRIDHIIQLGAVEEWTITNSADEDHNFHIHQNPYMLIEVNGETLDTPVWYDTFTVTGGGSIKFRTRFEDFVGKFVAHCHLLDHEELGMMQIVQVAEVINGMNVRLCRLTGYVNSRIQDRDRVAISGELDEGVDFEIPADEEVTVNLMANNPNEDDSLKQYTIWTQEISAGLARTSSWLYNYFSRESGIRRLVFRKFRNDRVSFRLMIDRFNLISEERTDLSESEYQALLESLESVTLVFSIGNKVWTQDIPVELGVHNSRVVYLRGV